MKHIIFSLLAATTIHGMAAETATITVSADKRLGRIEPMLYGQFIEHLGTCINGGIFEPGSMLADEHGFRRDVMEKVRELNPPMLRWPGGTFTKIYHWQDGIGTKEERRRRPNLIWGGEEDNLFGTGEFIRYCREIGAEPYISVNMGTGTAEEASNWVEYCNGTGDTHFANLRRQHGFAEPFGVKFWGLGNEEEAEPDCGRLQDPAAYAREAWQFAKLMKLQDPGIRLIVAGVGGDMKWNKAVLDSLHPVADFISAHWYLRAPDHLGLLDRVSAFERQITEWEGFLASYPAKPENFSQWYRFPHRQGKVRLAIDEWGLWAGGQGGRERLWNLEQTYTWQDALAVASWLNAMQRHPEIIGFATWAQMVNIIAPIQADESGSIRQTVFHPLALFAKHSRNWNVPVRCDSLPLADGKLPALDVAASVAEQGGGLSVFIVNRHPSQSIITQVDPGDAKLAMTGGIELAAPALDAANQLARREQDCVRRRELPAASGPVRLTLPAASVTVVLFAPHTP